MSDLLSIGQLELRSGVSSSALRFYESKGLIESTRSDGGQRRFTRATLRRVAFIRIAQRVGLSLEEIGQALDSLPDSRTPTAEDWAELSERWTGEIEERIRLLTAMRDQLSSCIGCGCLSFESCALYNPSDAAKKFGLGPRYLLGNSAADLAD